MKASLNGCGLERFRTKARVNRMNNANALKRQFFVRQEQTHASMFVKAL